MNASPSPDLPGQRPQTGASDSGEQSADLAAQFQFGPFSADLQRRELRRGQEVVKTTPKTFALLTVLLRNRHRVVTHDELIALVWPFAQVSQGLLAQIVRKLRLTLKSNPGAGAPDDDWIQAIRGVGYRFVGPVQAPADEQRALTEPADGVQGGQAQGDSAASTPLSRSSDLPGTDALYECGREQIRRADMAGLADTVAALRSVTLVDSSRRRLIMADLFESHVERFKGDSHGAWRRLESAQLLMMDGVKDLRLQLDLHTMRGQFFETFTSHADALFEYEKAWELALKLNDMMVLSGCAARLSSAHLRVGNRNAFETWSRESLQRAAQCHSHAIWLYSNASAGMLWMDLGNQLLAAGHPGDARDAWSTSVRLNELVLSEAAGLQGLERAVRMATVNRLALLPRLHPGQLAPCVAGLESCLADESHPLGRMQLMEELALLLHSAGRNVEARAHCRAAQETGLAHGIQQRHDSLLALSADIAQALGDLGGAIESLRALLQWREDQAAARAKSQSAVMAIRLDTEHLLALADGDRARVLAQTSDADILSQPAEVLEGADLADDLNGLASQRQFERHLTQTWAAARARGVPLCLALVGISVGPALAEGPGHRSRRDMIRRDVGDLLLGICRGGDLVAALAADGVYGLVFDLHHLSRAKAVCQRIQLALQAYGADKGLQIDARFVLDDVAKDPDPAGALLGLHASLAASARAAASRGRSASQVAPPPSEP